jgi:uncharacterized protein (DUF1015 family)
VLAPFRGLRYAAEKVSGLAEVTSPPYDAIGPGSLPRLLAADPHNVVRLILPHADPAAGTDGCRVAAGTLGCWIAEGVLAADPRPAIYIYEQSTGAERPEQGGTARGGDARSGPGGEGAALPPGRVLQRGLIGALRLSPPGAGVVLPHEGVMPGPVTGRRELMEATAANLEPIFLLYDGSPAGIRVGGTAAGQAAGAGPAAGAGQPAGAGQGRHCGDDGRGPATRLVDEIAATREPLLAAVTEDGITHRLWAMTDPEEQAAIAADLAPRQALIADGHHRYAAYLELQARRRAAGEHEGPWDHGLALLVDADAYPPRIGAMHRVIPGLPPADAVALAKVAFTVRALPPGLPAAVRELAEAGRSGPAFLIAGGGELHLADHPDPVQVAQAMPAGRSPAWCALPSSILRELLLRRLWQVEGGDAAVRVVHQDAAAAVRAADEAGGTAVLGNPVSAADVRDVAARGERMPPKSTSFGPKARTGLLLRAFAYG